jgi:hypothetical protein
LLTKHLHLHLNKGNISEQIERQAETTSSELNIAGGLEK